MVFSLSVRPVFGKVFFEWSATELDFSSTTWSIRDGFYLTNSVMTRMARHNNYASRE